MMGGGLAFDITLPMGRAWKSKVGNLCLASEALDARILVILSACSIDWVGSKMDECKQWPVSNSDSVCFHMRGLGEIRVGVLIADVMSGGADRRRDSFNVDDSCLCRLSQNVKTSPHRDHLFDSSQHSLPFDLKLTGWLG